MCGIAGCVTSRRVSGWEPFVRRMADTISHRGPDEAGYYSDEYAWFGHRRLSIIDLSTGQQPMCNEDRSAWIIYNGEIFNHSTIRPELEAAGHVYRTHCDTETILHAWEQFGPSCVERFRGMFAFTIWDIHRRKLFCARDRLGIKPFYYFWDGSTFVFASEIKALLQHPLVGTRFEESMLPEYLAFGYTSGDQTLFSGIKKLPAGHWLEVDVGSAEPSLRLQRYWDPPVPGAIQYASDEEWISECRRRLEETVRMRMMSDVPLGVFLSGGVDSSAIAALVARNSSKQINTFSVGYSEAAYSELPWARQAAEAIGSDHHEVLVSRDDFFNALPKLIWHEDEPISWPSSVSLYFVSRLASERVKVVLTGEGSDELFAGYHRYRTYLLNDRVMKMYGVVPEFVRSWVRHGIGTSRLISGSLRRKLGHTVLGREGSFSALYVENFLSAFSREQQARLLGSPGSVLDNYLRYWNASAQGRTTLSRLLYTDQKTYLVELLMKQDQMSMACSIESRVPFLDHHFVEFAANVPESLKIRNGSGKYILKKAVEGLIPNEIIYRRKLGFPTPLRNWLRERETQSLVDSVFRPGSFCCEYLDGDAIRELVDLHRNGVEDGTDRIWRLVNLELWGSQFFGTGLKNFESASGPAVAF